MLAIILQPIVFLLGGFGCGAVVAIGRFFDPEYNCIILFDQVGASFLSFRSPNRFFYSKSILDIILSVDIGY